ncbi:MAG: hypothetical protein ABIZ56_03450 [Chthoniobacteraceae bacterium]
MCRAYFRRSIATGTRGRQIHGVKFPLLIVTAIAAFAVSSRGQQAFSAPRKTVEEVLRAAPSPERFVVSGVVTHSTVFGFFIVQDATGAAFVYAARDSTAPTPQPGDRADVEGIKQTARFRSPMIHEAVWRVTGHEPLPEPPLITEAQVMTGDFDGRRVRIRGRVLEFETIPTGPKLTSRLWVRTGEQTCYVSYVAREYAESPAEPGARVEIVGVASMLFGTERVMSGYAMHLHSMADVRVLPEPPPWEEPATRRTLLIAGAVLAAAGAWIFLLRREVRSRTAGLAASEVRNRRVVDTALDAVISIDGSGTITGWNAQAEHTFVLDRRRGARTSARGDDHPRATSRGASTRPRPRAPDGRRPRLQPPHRDERTAP